jgi:uroporphyrin-3 C-methyltransferase
MAKQDMDTTDHETTHEAAAAGPEIEADQPETSSPASTGRLPLWLMMALIALALAWQTWEDFQRNKRLQQQVAHIQAQIAQSPDLAEASRKQLQGLKTTLSNQLRALEKRVTDLEHGLADIRQIQDARWSSLQSQLDHLARTLNDKQPDAKDDLSLSQATTLIKAAQWQLALQQPLSGVVSLLRAADDRLKQVRDPRVVLLREALARDLQILQAATDADLPGAFVAMSAWLEALDKARPVDLLHPPADAVTQSDHSNKEQPSWIRVLKKWFKVTHHDVVPRPPLAEYDLTALKLQLSLLVRQAQWHLLRGQYNALLDTLSQLKQQIRDAYDPGQETVGRLLGEITAMQARFSRPGPPRTLLAAEALEKFMARNSTESKP